MKYINKLILFDIDGTLTVKDRNVLLTNLKKVIGLYKDRGTLFGINTNRPIKDALSLYRALKLNGPIIVEDGAYYKVNMSMPSKVTVRGTLKLNRQITNFLRNWSKTKIGRKFTFKVSDNKDYLSNKCISALILITPQRIFTASIYIRIRGKKNIKALQVIYKLLQKKFQNKFKLVIFKKNLLQGKILIGNLKTNRFNTLHQIGYKFFKSRDMLLISDDECVPRVISDPKIHFASVSNGTAEYKKHCTYIANQNGANGIIWLVKKFLES
ncbi:MAG: HAD hydrolase family protein [Patescibacteria group bacterium]|nr:HAD hydrolase family protein [Patescibacteria group bacterium]